MKSSQSAWTSTSPTTSPSSPFLCSPHAPFRAPLAPSSPSHQCAVSVSCKTSTHPDVPTLVTHESRARAVSLNFVPARGPHRLGPLRKHVTGTFPHSPGWDPGICGWRRPRRDAGGSVCGWLCYHRRFLWTNVLAVLGRENFIERKLQKIKEKHRKDKHFRSNNNYYNLPLKI